MSRNDHDVLIIGGGVIGACTAYYLAQAGRSVTLIEQGEIGGTQSSSYGNAGFVVPGHTTPLPAPGVLSKALRWMIDPASPFYIKPRLDLSLGRWLWRFAQACRQQPMRRSLSILRKLGLASMELFEELAATAGPSFGYEQQGRLLLYLTQQGYQSGLEEARLLAEYGVQYQAMGPTGVYGIEPLASPSIAGGIFYPGEAHLMPDRFVQTVASLAEQRGAELQPNTTVQDFETAHGRIVAVRTSAGAFHPDQVVLAAGAWIPILAARLSLSLPIQPAKGYSITIRRPDLCPTVPISLAERKVGVTPTAEWLRFAGTLELAGFDRSINRRRLRAIQKAAHEYLPGLQELEVGEEWAGLRPATPDGLPIVGRSQRVENLVFAGGHGMLGMTLGPATGKLVAQLLAGEEPLVDPAALSPERFS